MDDTGKTVKQFVRDYFGYKRSFLGGVAAAEIGFNLLFAFVFALGIRQLNFQKR